MKILVVALLSALGAWLFWYVTGESGFYIVGLIVVVAYAERIYKRIKKGRVSDLD
ncbi:hypothetical protein [Vibrio owensii]|uniref:Uncharacterized protein n=1 Tax=Vibrio owensii TaxID=696485 RepID=A0AAP9KC84_9VIBR|nr:hypothetical protein [Vibrio owensii]QGH49255.1 hypothetical protein APZ19_19240 [Vibrio owensii]